MLAIKNLYSGELGLQYLVCIFANYNQIMQSLLKHTYIHISIVKRKVWNTMFCLLTHSIN